MHHMQNSKKKQSSKQPKQESNVIRYKSNSRNGLRRVFILLQHLSPILAGTKHLDSEAYKPQGATGTLFTLRIDRVLPRAESGSVNGKQRLEKA